MHLVKPEPRGDPVPHWKLKVKWSGPYIFIPRNYVSMLLIRTMPSEKDWYKAKNFALHISKLRLHERQAEPGPHLDSA